MCHSGSGVKCCPNQVSKPIGWGADIANRRKFERNLTVEETIGLNVMSGSLENEQSSRVKPSIVSFKKLIVTADIFFDANKS
jgi:hypothetical protein